MTAANILALLAIAITALVSLSALGWFIYKRGSANGKTELGQDNLGLEIAGVKEDVEELLSLFHTFNSKHSVYDNDIVAMKARIKKLEARTEEDHARLKAVEARLDIPSPSRVSKVVPDEETVDMDPV